MWAIRPSFILMACAAPAGARRIAQHEQAQTEAQTEVSSEAMEQAASESNTSIWELIDHRFCISEDTELTCGEYSTIVVKSAFYNKAKKDVTTGKECAPFAFSTEEQDEDEAHDSCTPKNTGFIGKKCDGHHTCTLRVQDHKSCVSAPFTFMRVRFGCDSVPVKPEDKEEEEDQAPATPVIVKPDGDGGNTGPALEMPGVPKVLPKGHKGIKVSKALDEQKKRDEGIKLTRCYRKNRFQKMMELNPLGRLTACGKHESCFKVAFQNPDGSERWYEDETQRPDDDVFLQGKLVTGDDRFVVAWSRGIGLKRSDYYSWGICLPNNGEKPLEYAMGIWESLKAKEALKAQLKIM